MDESVIHSIGDAFGNLPEDFHIHPRVKPVYEARQKMAYNGNIDWAFAELLAIGSLVREGRTVRLAGQDSQRGTFTQRHVVVVDKTTSETYSPLQNLRPGANYPAVLVTTGDQPMGYMLVIAIVVR